MHSTVVVLPAPLGPRIPKISASSTENDTSSTATVPPYRLCTFLTSITAICRPPGPDLRPPPPTVASHRGSRIAQGALLPRPDEGPHHPPNDFRTSSDRLMAARALRPGRHRNVM